MHIFYIDNPLYFLHWCVCHAGGSEAGEDLVEGDEGGLGGHDDTLAAALAPHVDPAVLAHGG